MVKSSEEEALPPSPLSLCLSSRAVYERVHPCGRGGIVTQEDHVCFSVLARTFRGITSRLSFLSPVSLRPARLRMYASTYIYARARG